VRVTGIPRSCDAARSALIRRATCSAITCSSLTVGDDKSSFSGIVSEFFCFLFTKTPFRRQAEFAQEKRPGHSAEALVIARDYVCRPYDT
jgi:hypothetical protein